MVKFFNYVATDLFEYMAESLRKTMKDKKLRKILNITYVQKNKRSSVLSFFYFTHLI